MPDRSPFVLTQETEQSLRRVAQRLGKSEGATLDAAVRVLDDILNGELELREPSPVSGASSSRTASARR